MKTISLDPRVNRMELPGETAQEEEVVKKDDHFHTYEVFTQKKKGTQHVHVGIVHAPDPQMAIVYAKEQFTRRGETANVWVVKSSAVHATSYDDADIFATTPEKTHRDPGTYKVRDKVNKYREEKANEKQ